MTLRFRDESSYLETMQISLGFGVVEKVRLTIKKRSGFQGLGGKEKFVSEYLIFPNIFQICNKNI